MIEELSPQTIEQIAIVVKDKISPPGNPFDALGGLTDVWVLIALIIPGFIAYWIIALCIHQKIQESQFLTTIFSLILSLLIYLPILIYSENVTSINDIRTIVTDPVVLAMILSLAAIYGIIIGKILKRTVYKQVVKDHAWARFCSRNLSKQVLVTLKDSEGGKRYAGKLTNYNDSKDEPAEIVLSTPYLIKNASKVSLGLEIYIPASVIKNIVGLKKQDSPA